MRKILIAALLCAAATPGPAQSDVPPYPTNPEEVAEFCQYVIFNDIAGGTVGECVSGFTRRPNHEGYPALVCQLFLDLSGYRSVGECVREMKSWR